MSVTLSPRFSLAVVGVGACLTLGACGSQEPVEPVPPGDGVEVAALQTKRLHCDVFGNVSGAVAKRVRITVSLYCFDAPCSPLVPSPKSTYTNTAGEFEVSGPNCYGLWCLDGLVDYVVMAEKEGYTFDGPIHLRCIGEPLGPLEFVATPVAASP